MESIELHGIQSKIKTPIEFYGLQLSLRDFQGFHGFIQKAIEMGYPKQPSARVITHWNLASSAPFAQEI